MPERHLFLKIFAIFLTIARLHAVAKPVPSPRAEANEVYSERLINIHQPVYQSGYGNFQTVKPMFMTPPPPVIRENKILATSPVYSPKEVRIATQTKVVSYPMHTPNQFNYYQFPRTYNPYLGKDSPANTYHPHNMIYGPQPFVPVGGYGLSFGPSGEMPSISNDIQKTRNYYPQDFIPTNANKLSHDDGGADLSLQMNNQRRNLSFETRKRGSTVVTRQEEMPVGTINPVGYGYNTMDGVGYDPYSAQMGPFGPQSSYAVSTERQLAFQDPRQPYQVAFYPKI